MVDLIIANFNKIAGTILSAAFVGYIGYRTYQKTRSNAAVDKFRGAIINELASLYPEGIYYTLGGDAVKILREKHHIINAAVIEFRPFVSDKKKFDIAWENFSGIGVFRDKEEQARYNQYSFTGHNCHFYEKPKEMFILNLEKLLEFAKHR